MAKSKAGGTRAYIRGKIGADVYSIGKDGRGRKQQVVRSLAEQVHNPQTTAQMRGRMIMSTIMQAVASMSPIIDHSFDGVPAGQPSISEFIRLNYGLIKADVAAHPSAGNQFGLNKYQEKGIKLGSYQISKGTVNVPGWLENFQFKAEYVLSEGDTLQEVLDAMGITVNDYLTVCYISTANTEEGEFCYMRIKPADNINVSLPAIEANVSSAFVVETNDIDATGIIGGTDASGDKLSIIVTSHCPTIGGVIISKKTANGFVHSTAKWSVGNQGVDWSAAVALPTYPVGSERFLNGGEI